MASLSIGISIGIAILMLFIYYTTGCAINELFNINFRSPFSCIALGFFVYFAFISFLSLPLQLISVLPYVFFVYYTIALTILYALFGLLFHKFWISTSFISVNTIVFFGLVFIFMGFNIFGQKYITNQDFGSYKNTLAIMMWLKEYPVSFFSGSTLYNFLGFKPFQGFYTFQLAILLISNAQSYQYQDILKPFGLIMDSFIAAAIFMSMFTSFNRLKKEGNKWILLIVSLILFCGAKTILFYYDSNVWNEREYFIYLIFYSIILMLKYTSSIYRMRNLPTIVGIVLGGYIAFSWEGSYPILFLLYSFIFILQRSFVNNFTKDLFKIGSVPLISFIFFNIIRELYFQAIFFGAIVVLLWAVGIVMRRRYTIVTKFEFFIKEYNSLSILIFPVIFAIISAGIALAQNQNIFSLEENYLNFLYIWSSFVSNSTAKTWITFVLSIGLLAFSAVWTFIRSRFRNSTLTTAVDLAVVSYLTFYNPFVIRFINMIYPNMMEQKGVIMILLFITIVNSAVYTISHSIEKKKLKKQNKNIKVTVLQSYKNRIIL